MSVLPKPDNEPFLAYQLIEIVDNLSLATHKLIGPILVNSYCPEILKKQAKSLLTQADLLCDQTADHPDLDRLKEGIGSLKNSVEQFMRIVANYTNS